VEIHLVKEGRVIAKDSRSQDKFMHDIHVAVAKHYSENLREEVKKGMREKAEEGIYPSRPPFGYKNNPATRSIEVDPQRAPVLRGIFELYASGQHSLTTLRQPVLRESSARLSRAYLENILKNPSALVDSTGKASSTKARMSRWSRRNCSSRCRIRSPDGTNRNTPSTTSPSPDC
jgi:site-specific DNA recombinase